ncbi:YciI family protein [Chitinophaga sp. 30R24]|uniref:YciI family protein n=1 Tax=Chitinophaga sp. 30R24 TaxID=3248838 RepID=UPI003B8F7FE1
MASKVIPALLLLGFIVIVILSFHPTSFHSVTPGTLSAQVNPGESAELKRYWMVFLRKGRQRNQDTTNTEKIQHAHLNHLSKLAAAGQLLVAGPFSKDDDLRGILIMNCGDSLEVISLINQDPAITSGRLRFEVKPWYTVRNCVFR